jgi:hypothetical protein
VLKRNRGKTEESAQADQGDRFGFCIAEKSRANRREEKSDSQIGQETEATCQESSVTLRSSFVLRHFN